MLLCIAMPTPLHFGFHRKKNVLAHGNRVKETFEARRRNLGAGGKRESRLQ